jgi:molybdenum cofactor guanylyltransferase
MTFSAVLLAGGESRRMGRDKANVLFRGKPLWQVQLETLQKLEAREIFVSARIDPPWRPDGVPFVGDVAPSRGPLSGLAASVDRMSTSHLLALAIDMPFMTENYLHCLCDQIEPGRGVVPKIGSRFEPLAAAYPREAEIDFRSALAGADYSLQTVVGDLVESGKLRELLVTAEDKRSFMNVNALSDLQSA